MVRNDPYPLFKIMPLKFIVTFVVLISSLHAQHGKAELPLGPNKTKATLHFFKFSSKTHELKVIDQGTDQKPRYTDLASAMRANGCIAGCNGGFFQRDGKPLGLVVSNGLAQGVNNQKSSLTSGTIYVEKGSISLVRTTAFSKKTAPMPRQVLQTGPFLVEDGQSTRGLSNRKFARRTVLATDNQGNWAILYTPPTTLSQLGDVLAKSGAINGFTIRQAINLDGGSSSGLWVNKENQPLYFHEVRKVRNFLGVTRK